MTIAPVFMTVRQAKRGHLGRSVTGLHPIAPGKWQGHVVGTDVNPIVYDPKLWRPIRAGTLVVRLERRESRAGLVNKLFEWLR